MTSNNAGKPGPYARHNITHNFTRNINAAVRRQRQIADTFIRHKRTDFAQKDVTLRRINLKLRIWK
ncbi:unknown [Prevotella sp. CAG:1185]|nr:unknown [Prevotella sp. CAG:1185]